MGNAGGARYTETSANLHLRDPLAAWDVPFWLNPTASILLSQDVPTTCTVKTASVLNGDQRARPGLVEANSGQGEEFAVWKSGVEPGIKGLRQTARIRLQKRFTCVRR